MALSEKAKVVTTILFPKRAISRRWTISFLFGLMRLKSKSWEPRMVATVSGVILAVGLVLFVDRAFLGG